MSFRVLQPGTFSLIVDLGRPASRSLGVPLGGAADRAALMLGNGLVGNPPNLPALEITLSGPVLRAESDVCACLFGAAFALRVEEVPVAPACLFSIRAGQTLRIGAAMTGARGYLCVRGGFESRTVLDSRTALAPIAQGDVLACPPSAGAGVSLSHPDAQSLLGEVALHDRIRVIPGPQADWFPSGALPCQDFRVSPSSNRMGVRLEGTPLPRPDREIVSEAVAPGAVQITNEGLPIILGVDGQTIGGYPKVAHVIDADLDRIGQLRPGQSVRFEQVDLETAERLAAGRRDQLRHWRTRLNLSQPG